MGLAFYSVHAPGSKPVVTTFCPYRTLSVSYNLLFNYLYICTIPTGLAFFSCLCAGLKAQRYCILSLMDYLHIRIIILGTQVI